MKYVTGNLLDAGTQALVNTVNTVGVMGKGIALQFKEQFPYNSKVYTTACKNKEVEVGKMLVVKESNLKGEKIIINFPTKTEWYKKSQYDYIEEGLKDLKRVIREYNIESISIPPLGCGNGGLKWEKVKNLMDKYLADLVSVEIVIFQPNDAVKEILQKENTRKVELTKGKAILLYALFLYERTGETASVFAANKLAYFLQRSGEQLRYNFIPYNYGPYDQAVEKVLYSMNGKYLNGLEQMKAKPFEHLNLDYSKLDEVEEYIRKNLAMEQRQRIKNLFRIIEGFESTLSLEILSSIDFLIAKEGKLTKEALLPKIQTWNQRKKELIDLEHIEIALQHLNEYGLHLHFA